MNSWAYGDKVVYIGGGDSPRHGEAGVIDSFNSPGFLNILFDSGYVAKVSVDSIRSLDEYAASDSKETIFSYVLVGVFAITSMAYILLRRKH